MFNSKKAPSSGVIVKGMTGLLVRYAGCCNPVPGDKIIGFISRGRGVAVHRADCPNVKSIEPDRLIETEWAGNIGGEFTASIKVVASEQGDILSAVSNRCSAMNLKIVLINGRFDQKTKNAVVDFSILLNSKQDLDTLILKLKQEPKIIDVFRVST